MNPRNLETYLRNPKEIFKNHSIESKSSKSQEILFEKHVIILIRKEAEVSCIIRWWLPPKFIDPFSFYSFHDFIGTLNKIYKNVKVQHLKRNW